jgi:ABC-type antimicrobial peptide transport system permease subunit
MVTRYLERLLFGLTSLDPATFVLGAAIMAAVATVATLIPALRATRIDPVRALREG